jgi:DNA-binding XRE family transcriptional regulator
MTSGGSGGGCVRALILKGREAASLNQSQLAERAGVSRSRIIAAEAGTSLPTMELCLKLAAALRIPAGEMAAAYLRDSVHAVAPDAAAEVENALWTGSSHWEAIAEHHRLRIGLARVLNTVNESGDATLVRHFSSCLATRPRSRIVFRDRIIGERAPAFAVKGAPKGLGYSMHVSIEGEWAQHRVEFHRPWTEEDGPFELEFETVLPRAYVLDLDEYNRRRKTEGLAPKRDWMGDFRFVVTYAFEKVEMVIRFPKSYEPAWCDPTATWGTAPLDDFDYHELDRRTCRASQFRPGTNEAALLIDRPVPGFTCGIRWKPIAWEPESRGEEK